MKLVVDATQCCGSGECIKVCPVNAISIVGGVAVIHMDRCDLDGICIPACPYDAIDYQDS